MSEKATWIGGVGRAGIPAETWRVRASRPGGCGQHLLLHSPSIEFKHILYVRH